MLHYIHTLKRIIFKQQQKNDLPFQNDGQITTDFHFASFRFWRKIKKKKHFLKGILAHNRRL